MPLPMALLLMSHPGGLVNDTRCIFNAVCFPGLLNYHRAYIDLLVKSEETPSKEMYGWLLRAVRF